MTNIVQYIINGKKDRRSAWDSNSGLQDGRRIYGAMAAHRDRKTDVNNYKIAIIISLSEKSVSSH